MRIVSLLPSATEIVYALGLGGALVGVTDECDFPPEARDVPAVSHARLATSAGDGGDGQGRPGAGDSPVLAPGEVDRAVRDSLDRGEPLYRLDADRIRALQPDLILAQDLCRVCAVPSGMVEEALDRIGCR
ncbi:MAG TPA: hypothetical protein VE152_14100, partial [Acidimicrobiales bacterium]|nr:hypothetical protein [Acidimicrobiales bacterium]